MPVRRLLLVFRRHFSYASRLRKEQEIAPDVDECVFSEKDANITLIAINRPHQRNSITTPAAAQLCEAFNKFEADDTSPVAVLYGVGGSFSAGHDLDELEEQTTQQGSLEFLFNPEGSVGPTRRLLRKPIVCAINGFCVASGLELALMCDLRVMEDTAILGFFNRGFGVPVSDGGSVRLARAVGCSRAMDLLCTGRRVYGAEALHIGLVNRLVATGTGLGQAVNLAFSIGKFPQAALLHDRIALHNNTYSRGDFNAAIQNEIMTMSSEVVQGIQEGARRFINSKTKGAKTDSWRVKKKDIPDWEMDEIAYEEAYAQRKPQR